jgi:glycosyltransferase involved in cell wall biosynthesis
MRVAVFHNRYAQRGGEDRAVDLEVEGLRKAGHEVHPFLVDSRSLRSTGDVVRAGWRAGWNEETARRVDAFLAAHPVDVGHVHNFFPLLSPAVHTALRGRGVAVVQSLHNYRLVCANGLFLRKGRPCEDCVARGPWNAVRHGCYRGSRAQTLAWARATAEHRARGLWTRLVDRFVAPSAFLRDKLAAAGLPAERMRLKPNAVPDPGEPRWGGRGAVFVGRLSREKGVHVLLEAWKWMGGAPLCIVGTGPEEAALRRRAGTLSNVRFTGELSREGVRGELAAATFAVVPSLWYENFPLVVAEAFAAGRPVVAARPTAVSDLVSDGLHGLHFERGDASSLARACLRLVADPELCEQMGREARAHYEEHLTPQRANERLVEIYAEARLSA